MSPYPCWFNSSTSPCDTRSRLELPAVDMPQPPPERSPSDAAPDRLVSLLYEQVKAERLLADARHKEILAFLSQDSAHFREIETALEKDNGCTPMSKTMSEAAKMNDRANKLSELLVQALDKPRMIRMIILVGRMIRMIILIVRMIILNSF